MRRLLIGGALAALLFGASVPAALAVSPEQGSFDVVQNYTTDDICPFEVTVRSTVTGHFQAFFDQAGNNVSYMEHDVFVDTLSANGKTLLGEPVRTNFQFSADASGITKWISTGAVERVMLPDGTMFWSAGRFDWLAHPGVNFTITPDNGRSGNVAAFCAALAP